MIYNKQQPQLFAGGDEQIRTAGLRLARAALSQLSYIPMVGPPGLEPGTLPLSGVRSSHLSYEPSNLKNIFVNGRADSLVESFGIS